MHNVNNIRIIKIRWTEGKFCYINGHLQSPVNRCGLLCLPHVVGGVLSEDSGDLSISPSSTTIRGSLSEKTWNKNPSPLPSSFLSEHLPKTEYFCPSKIPTLKPILNVMVQEVGPLGE